MMDEQGWGGFSMHSRLDCTPTRTEEMDASGQGLRGRSQKAGMSAWLYDEDVGPVVGGGAVPSLGERYRMKNLVAIDEIADLRTW